MNWLLGSYFGRNRNIKVYLATIAIENIALPFIKENWYLMEAMANRFTNDSQVTATDIQDESEAIVQTSAATKT